MTKIELKALLDNFLDQIFFDYSSAFVYPKLLLGEDAKYKARNAIFSKFMDVDMDLKVSEKVEKIYGFDNLGMTGRKLVEKLCKTVVYEIENSKDSETEDKSKIISEAIEKFMLYLDNIPKEINYYLIPCNIEIDADIEGLLYENLYIKQATPTLSNLLPNKIIILRINPNKQSYLNEKFEFEKLFSLYELGKIYLKELNNDLDIYLDNFSSFLNKDSKTNNYPHIPPFSHWTLHYKYKINKDNFEDLKNFLSFFKQIREKLDKDNFINISINFYKTALEKFGPAEQITYATIALEALYNTDSNEITKTLKLRSGKVLSKYYSKELTEKIINDIGQAYKCRCDYVHGKGYKQVEFDLARNILYYTRLSIILFLQLSQSVSMKKNIKRYINENLIDKALTHQDFDEELTKKLSECLLFNLKDTIYEK